MLEVPAKYPCFLGSKNKMYETHFWKPLCMIPLVWVFPFIKKDCVSVMNQEKKSSTGTKIINHFGFYQHRNNSKLAQPRCSQDKGKKNGQMRIIILYPLFYEMNKTLRRSETQGTFNI